MRRVVVIGVLVAASACGNSGGEEPSTTLAAMGVTSTTASASTTSSPDVAPGRIEIDPRYTPYEPPDIDTGVAEAVGRVGSGSGLSADQGAATSLAIDITGCRVLAPAYYAIDGTVDIDPSITPLSTLLTIEIGSLTEKPGGVIEGGLNVAMEATFTASGSFTLPVDLRDAFQVSPDGPDAVERGVDIKPIDICNVYFTQDWLAPEPAELIAAPLGEPSSAPPGTVQGLATGYDDRSTSNAGRGWAWIAAAPIAFPFDTMYFPDPEQSPPIDLVQVERGAEPNCLSTLVSFGSIDYWHLQDCARVTARRTPTGESIGDFEIYTDSGDPDLVVAIAEFDDIVVVVEAPSDAPLGPLLLTVAPYENLVRLYVPTP